MPAIFIVLQYYYYHHLVSLWGELKVRPAYRYKRSLIHGITAFSSFINTHHTSEFLMLDGWSQFFNFGDVANSGFDHPGQIQKGSRVHGTNGHHNHHVHYVVGIEQYVNLAWDPLFWNTSCSYCTSDHSYQVLLDTPKNILVWPLIWCILKMFLWPFIKEKKLLIS